MTKFQIVTNGARQSDRFETDDPIAAFAERGYQMQHLAPPRLRVLRAELQDQPVFAGLCGPMWGGTDEAGKPIIRYEDWKSYEILSR